MVKEKKDQEKTETEDSPTQEAEEAQIKDDSDETQEEVTSEQECASEKEESISELKEQLVSEKDKVLRLSAEFENYKKRKQRELDEFKKFANETVFRQLLGVVDNLERAILSAGEVSDDDGLLEGIKLTYRDIIKLLESFNVKPVEAENKPFDPNFHQAVNQEGTDEVPENTVITVLQKGYLLHDRLIRPAMVVVSKKLKKKTEETKEN